MANGGGLPPSGGGGEGEPGSTGSPSLPPESERDRLQRESAERVRRDEEASRQRIAQDEARAAAQEARRAAEAGGPNAGVQGLEEIAGQTPAQEQAAARAGGAGKPPAPPEAPTAAPEPPKRPEVPQTDEERLIAAMERLTPEQLQRRIDGLERNLGTINRRLDRVTSLSDMETLQDTAENLQTQIDLLREIQDEKGGPPPEGARRERRATREEIAEAVRLERQQAEEVARYTKMNLNDLGNEKEIARATANMLADRVRTVDTRDPAYQALRAEADRVKAKADELERIYNEKEIVQKEATKKAEAETHVRDLQELQAKVGPPAEIQKIVDALQGEFNKSKAEIARITQELANAKEEAAKDKLRGELAHWQQRAADSGKRLVDEKEALAAAKKRVREEQGLKQTTTPETVRVMSIEEFNKLTPAEKTKYFVELGDAHGKPLKTEYEAIIKKLDLASENLTFEDAGKLVRYLSESLFNKDGVKDAVRNLHKVNVYNPELAQAVLDRVTAREDFQKALREKYPSDWEKVLKFASRNKGWLIILLLILAGAITAGAAVVGAGAAAAGGAGVAGGGAGAAGAAFGLGRRSNA